MQTTIALQTRTGIRSRARTARIRLEPGWARLPAAIAAGAVAGTVVGPVGTLLGAAAGAIAGGLTGKGVAEIIDPTIEEAYWRTSYSSRPYVTRDATFDDYGPAYRYGVSSYSRYPGRTFGQAEAELRRDWELDKGGSRLTWNEARHAVRDSWQRVSDSVESAAAGDSDRDGK
jgi:hypothetical protein